MIRAAQSAVLVAALALFASALAADTDDPWGSDPKTTCWHDLNREVPPRHRGPARGENPVSVKKTHRPTTAARAKRKLDAECVCLHPYADHRLEHSQIGVREVPVRRLHATQSAGLEPNYFAIRTGSFRPPLMSRVA